MQSQSAKPTIFSSHPYIILKNQEGKSLTPMQLTKNHHVLGRDPQLADLTVPLDWGVVSRCQASFKKINNNYYIYDGDGTKASSNKLFINNSVIAPTEGYRITNGDEIKIGQDSNKLVIIQYFDPTSIEVTKPKIRSISLKNRSVILGRDPNASLQLEAPTVSRRHATIDQDNQGRYILQDYSTNGVFVNGQKVEGSAILSPGANIHIGPYRLILQGDELVLADSGENIRLDAENILRVVKDKNSKKLILLNHISLPIEPGQLVALVGGSGAGKSTFMRTLLGIEPTTEGTVYLNGEDLRKNFNIYRNQIGYVPQTDIVHKDLRVEEVLIYAAQLRLPTDFKVKEVVEKTLEQIEMSDRRDVLVKNLSGGQLKRVSIGVELLADPKLFFLDEPTSGLDPGLDKKMMLLLRKLADQGRTIILVTHATSNITLCDRLVFLGRGGNLCYFGPPQKAIDFFNIESRDFADIYIKLEREETVLEEAEKFNLSDYKKSYIDNRLSTKGEENSPQSSPKKVKRSFLEQLSILSKRNFKLTLRDPINLGLALLTAPLGISLITLAIRNKDPLILGEEVDPTLAPLALQVLFVFTSAAIWVGLASSLQEIVKEVAIYQRERLVNLGLFAYLGSKMLILGGLALLQTLLMSMAILIGFEDPKPDLIPWLLGIIITTYLTLFSCISLGLMVSASVKNSSQANSALPLLLLPQIIFSGVLFNMEGIGKYISWLMLSRWSVAAYGALVDVNSMVIKNLPNLPFEGSDVYNQTWGNIILNWVILLLHAAIYLGVTFWVQKRKDIL